MRDLPVRVKADDRDPRGGSQALVQYLETHRVVAPGYSFLQDVVSRALGKERDRLTSLLDTRLDEATRKALDRLYLERDGGYGVTPLKQDPKDFSRREMARCRSLEPLYRTAMALLPELGISNDSIAYYAALVDYYTVQKLQQLTQGMARLYLLCFLLQSATVSKRAIFMSATRCASVVSTRT